MIHLTTNRIDNSMNPTALFRASAFALLLIVLVASPLQAQNTAIPVASDDASVVITLDEAIQISLVQNLALKNVRLDLENAQAQIKEGWSELFPQIDLNSSYTRNVKSPNPFAGSEAGSFFESFGFIDWLAFNEQARTDADAGTDPISVEEFFFRQATGYQNAGISRDLGDNPFSVPNVYSAGLSISQKLFDGRIIFGAVGASKWLKPFNESAISREEQVLIRNVKAAWYASLLAVEQVRVADQSVIRARRTFEEVSRQVEQGTAPKFQRLSAEVELSNLETAQVQAAVNAETIVDNLRLLLGIPTEKNVQLRGDLESDVDDRFLTVSKEDAALTALNRRPDLRQAHIGIELEKIQLQVAKSEYLPNLNAFANFNWLGNVPDNRQIVSSVDGDPFSFTSSNRTYFDDSYWDRGVSVGFSLSWNIFNGLASHRRIQQRKIAVQQAENNLEFLNRSIRLEVEQALRSVRASHTRMSGQRKNVDTAELNFEYAEARLREGIATPLEVREASSQLDQTRMNYLQAVHDFLIAQSTYETAIGVSNEATDSTNR